MATEIIREIDQLDSKYHLKVGVLFCFIIIIIFYILKNTNNNNSIPFKASFSDVEGINVNTEVQIAGIKVGGVNKINLLSKGITIEGYIDSKYDIPEDSIMKIKSKGIFGRKTLSIEPGFGENMDKTSHQYIFNQTQDSYSVDMFFRYLNNLNE